MMATCNNCLHIEACKQWYPKLPDKYHDGCECFKDKSRYDTLIHGRWVGEGDGYADGELVYDVWYCDNCNYCIDDGTDDPEALPNFCPNCGARMREVKDPNEKWLISN